MACLGDPVPVPTLFSSVGRWSDRLPPLAGAKLALKTTGPLMSRAEIACFTTFQLPEPSTGEGIPTVPNIRAAALREGERAETGTQNLQHNAHYLHTSDTVVGQGAT